MKAKQATSRGWEPLFGWCQGKVNERPNEYVTHWALFICSSLEDYIIFQNSLNKLVCMCWAINNEMTLLTCVVLKLPTRQFDFGLLHFLM